MRVLYAIAGLLMFRIGALLVSEFPLYIWIPMDFLFIMIGMHLMGKYFLHKEKDALEQKTEVQE